MSKKTKQTLILLGILILLIFVYIIWQNPFQSEKNQPETESLINANFDEIKKIEIKSAAQEILLTYKNEQWVVESEQDFVANNTLINNLIDGLKNANQGSIISRDPEKADKFNLTPETATILKLSDDQQNQLAELYIGKVSLASANKTYVKNADSDNILLVNGNLNTLINQPTWLMVETEPEKEFEDSISPFETEADDDIFTEENQ